MNQEAPDAMLKSLNHQSNWSTFLFCIIHYPGHALLDTVFVFLLFDLQIVGFVSIMSYYCSHSRILSFFCKMPVLYLNFTFSFLLWNRVTHQIHFFLFLLMDTHKYFLIS